MKPKDRIEHNLNEIRSVGVIFAERGDENCCYLAPTEKTPQKEDLERPIPIFFTSTHNLNCSLDF